LPGSGSARILHARLERALSRSPSPRLLSLYPERITLSGAVLLREIAAFGVSLRSLGLRPGDRALLALTNPRALLLAVPALWREGCVPVLADSGPRPGELREQIRRLSPDLVVTDRPEAGRPARTALAPGIPLLRGFRPGPRHRLRIPARTVLVRTTSGSTGPGRCVALTGDQLLADTRGILARLRLTPLCCGLGAIPLGHAYGFATLLIPLLFHRHPMALLEHPLPEQIRAALGRHRRIFFPAVPPLLELLCRSGIAPALLRRISVCTSAGAPLHPATARRFRELAGTPVRNFYGTSETGAVACDASRRGAVPPGCAGTPLPEVRVFFEPVGGIDSPAGSGSPRAGRVGVRGPAVGLGYARAGGVRRFPGGRFLTGDLGRMDGRGRLHLQGRLDRIVNVGGLKVRPEEVETILASAPGVLEAAVVAIPDPTRGQAVGAVVSTRDARREDLLAFCRERLSPHKIPRRLLLLRELPRTPRGKVDLAGIRGRLSGKSSAGDR
jgi:acyl-coenzyme A synthetase/AMP-(fatty) acid ligase